MRALLALCLALLCFGAQAQGAIRVASDDWCPFVCADEHAIVGGYMVDALQEILALGERHAQPILLPLNRAGTMVESGILDAIYAPAIDERLVLSKPLAWSRACFYTPAASKWRYKDIASLRGANISVIDEYGYDGGAFDAYLISAKKSHAANVLFRTGKTAGEKGVLMLLAGRLPVMVEHEATMAYQLKLQGADAKRKVRQAGCLATPLPLVIGVSKTNPEAADLLRIINNGAAALQASGRLAALKKKYSLPN